MSDQLDLFDACPMPPQQRPIAPARQPLVTVDADAILAMKDFLEGIVPCGLIINLDPLLDLPRWTKAEKASLRAAVYGWGLWAKHPDGAYDHTRCSFVWDCGGICRRRTCSRHQAAA